MNGYENQDELEHIGIEIQPRYQKENQTYGWCHTNYKGTQDTLWVAPYLDDE